MLLCLILQAHHPAFPTFTPRQAQRRTRVRRWCSKPTPKSSWSFPNWSTSPATRSRSMPATIPQIRTAAACQHTSTPAPCLNVRLPHHSLYCFGWIHILMSSSICLLSESRQNRWASDSRISSRWTGICLHQMAGAKSTQWHDHTVWSQIHEDVR